MLKDLPKAERLAVCVEFAARALRLGQRLPPYLSAALEKYGKEVADYSSRQYALQLIQELRGEVAGEALFTEVARRLDILGPDGDPNGRRVRQFWEERRKAVRGPDGKRHTLVHLIADEYLATNPGRPIRGDDETPKPRARRGE